MIFIWFKIQGTAIGRFFFYCRFCWLNAKGRKVLNQYVFLERKGISLSKGLRKKLQKILTLKLLLSLNTLKREVHLRLKIYDFY